MPEFWCGFKYNKVEVFYLSNLSEFTGCCSIFSGLSVRTVFRGYESDGSKGAMLSMCASCEYKTLNENQKI